MKAQKAIACLLAGTLAAASKGLCLFGAGANAADLAAISISTVIAGEDGSFVTTVNLDTLPETGLCAMDFAVAYDSAALDISKIELLYDTGAEDAEKRVSPDFEGTVFSCEDIGGEIRVRWATALKNADYWLREERPLLQISGTMHTDTSQNWSRLRLIPATRETFEGSGVQNTTIVAGYVDSNGKTYNCKTMLTDGVVWRVLEDGVTMRGDLNMDARLTISDAVMVYKLVNEQELTLGAAAYANADCKPDGLLTMADVALILQNLEREPEDAALAAD